MSFCEECGAKLASGARFCEECGAKVAASAISEEIAEGCESARDMPDADSSSEAMNIFSGADWRRRWEAFADSSADEEIGIIVTREKKLLSHIGCTDYHEFKKLVLRYITSAAERNVRYAYCDLDDCTFHYGGGETESVVASLRRIVDVACPKYLFILGNEEIVDVVRWKNQVPGDADAVVESDLCYSTLDVNTPWDGQAYDFDEVMRVGRLPSRRDEGLASYFRYFENAVRFIGSMDKVRPYGLSALVWKDESNEEYKAISDDTVDVSPEITAKDVYGRIDAEANLFFFNLHGSNDTRFWYGQSASSYPEAFEPAILDGRGNPYFIGVEACYGARYLGGLDENQSVMMTAMRNRCMAFLGSSRIAFGAVKPEGCCADIVVGDFIRHLAEGRSVGDAHVEGLRHLSADDDGMDDTDVKTLAEFSLYGDPSSRMGHGKLRGDAGKSFKSLGSKKGLPIPMPDVRRRVQTALAEVDAKIEAAIDDFAMRNLLPELMQKGLVSARQAVFKMNDGGLNQKVYSLESGPIVRIAKVYFDNDGNIHKALVSK